MKKIILVLAGVMSLSTSLMAMSPIPPKLVCYNKKYKASVEIYFHTSEGDVANLRIGNVSETLYRFGAEEGTIEGIYVSSKDSDYDFFLNVKNGFLKDYAHLFLDGLGGTEKAIKLRCQSL